MNDIKQEQQIVQEAPTVEALCSKTLNTKKNIIEHIDAVQKIEKEYFEAEDWQKIYDFIYKSIEDFSQEIKANTVLQLKNHLKAGLGKRVQILNPIQESTFVTFMKEAYPEGKRRKDFTLTLADNSNITEEQILTTLKYISNWCNQNKLSPIQREDIKIMIKMLIKRGNLKYIKQVKSLEGLRKDPSLEKVLKSLQF